MDMIMRNMLIMMITLLRKLASKNPLQIIITLVDLSITRRKNMLIITTDMAMAMHMELTRKMEQQLDVLLQTCSKRDQRTLLVMQ